MELAWALFKVVLGTVLEALLGPLVEVLRLGRDRRDWARLPDEVLEIVARKVAAAEPPGRGLARMVITCKGWKEALKEAGVWRDWGNKFGEGLPEDLLVKVAETLVAQNEAEQAARLRRRGFNETQIQEWVEKRKRDGNCLFVFAMVSKEWRKAQLKVGGPLRTRVGSDVILPGRVELVKWALAEGCPREKVHFIASLMGMDTLATKAAWYGHLALVQWLCGEGDFAMDKWVISDAASSGNLELVRWLRGEGCQWDWRTCWLAVNFGHVEVLRWARENGCPWEAGTRDDAAAKFGYTDDLGNLVQ